jgi:hypothetical protein
LNKLLLPTAATQTARVREREREKERERKREREREKEREKGGTYLRLRAITEASFSECVGLLKEASPKYQTSLHGIPVLSWIAFVTPLADSSCWIILRHVEWDCSERCLAGPATGGLVPSNTGIALRIRVCARNAIYRTTLYVALQAQNEKEGERERKREK